MEDTSHNDSGSPAAPSGAPAAAAPASAPARPTSASAALESAARSAANPAPAPGVKPVGPAGGTGQPQAAAAIGQPAKPVPAQPSAKGPIPFDAHETALKNAREKARQEAVQEYAWANGVDPTVAQRALALAKRLDTDPRAFARQLQAELEEDPESSFPKADIKTANGIEAYSAQAMQKFADALRKQLMQEMSGQLKPIMDEREKAQQAAEKKRVTDAAIAEGRTVIKDAIAHARTLPLFNEHDKAISAKLGEISPETRSRVGLVAAMYMAYAAVLAEQVGKAKAAGGEETLTDLKRKAQAGAGNVTPGGPVAAQGKQRPKNPQELAAHMERLSKTLVPA